MKTKATVSGECDEKGYTVFLNGKWVYKGDAEPGTPRHNVRKFCVGRCREIALENNAEFGGVTWREKEA